MPGHVRFTTNGGLSLDAINVATLPQVLVGPMLRRVERNRVAIFLVLKSAQAVSITVWEDLNTSVTQTTSVTATDGVRAGRHVYVYVVDCAAPTGGFVAGQRYCYSVSVNEDAVDLSGLLLTGRSHPGFVGLPDKPEDLSVLHTSCRRPHGNFRDGLARAIEELEGSNPPQLLVMSGDQVYSDDTATTVMALIQHIGSTLVDIEEKDGNGKDIFHMGIQEIGHRQALTNLYGLSGDMAANHLWTLEEFYGHYLLAWSDVLWPDSFPENWSDVADQVMHDVPIGKLLQQSWARLRQNHPQLAHLSEDLAAELWMEIQVQWGQTSIVKRFAAKQRKHDDALRMDVSTDTRLTGTDVRPWPWDDLLVSVDASGGNCTVTLGADQGNSGDGLRNGAEITIQKMDVSSNTVTVVRQGGQINGQPQVVLEARAGAWMTFAVFGSDVFAFRHQGKFKAKERKLVSSNTSLRRDQLTLWDGIKRVHLLVDASGGKLVLELFADLPVDVVITVEKVDNSANAVEIKEGTGVTFDGGSATVSFTEGHRTIRLTALPGEGDNDTHYSVKEDAGAGFPALAKADEKLEQSYQTAWADELARVKEYRRTLPTIRKILANVPSLMIFDDHEVTDDWNLNFPWYLFAYGRNMFTGERNPGGQVVCNGLMAYLVFQHWGNVPVRAATADSAEQKALAALAWSGSSASTSPASHPGYDTMRPHLGLPVYGMTYEGAGVYTEWKPTTGTNHYQSEGFCLRVPSSDTGIRWDYRFGPADGYPVHLVCLDERTWRSCPDDDGPAARISKSALDLMWPAPTSTQADTLTLLVLSAPVLGLHVIEHLIQPLFGLMLQSGAATYDWESWSADTRGFERMLERIAQWKNVVILSGDVHFGYTKTLDYQKGTTTGRAIQFVASSSKYSDPKTLLIHLLGEFMEKLGAVRSREFVGWASRIPPDQFDKLLLLPHDAAGTTSETLPWDEILDVALGRVTRAGLGASVLTTDPEPLVLSRELADAYGLTGHAWSYTISHVDDTRLLDPEGVHMTLLSGASSGTGWDPARSLATVKALRANDMMRIGRVLIGMPMVARIDLERSAPTQPLRARQTLLLSPGVTAPSAGTTEPTVVTIATLGA